MTEKEVATETNGQEKNENNTGDETELESAIIRQVEYYFGDMNLGRDKYLREQVNLDDGWVPLDILIKFNRLAKLSTDTEVIAKALNKSTSGLLEVSEDLKKVRRSAEMPLPEMNEERRKELLSRTIYAKGFAKDAQLDDLLKFFNEQGEVENLIMRRYLDRATKNRLFKGSVFVTFKTKEEAEKFIDKKDIKYGETELLILWQEDYLKKKHDEYAEKKEQREKKIKEKEATAKQEAKDELKLPTGTVFHFSENDDTMKREHVKEALAPFGAEVAYIDFKQGDKEGWVRYSKENQAVEVNKKLTDGKLKIGETEVVFKLLEGEEEKAYLDKTVEEMVKRRKNQKTYSKNRNFKGKQGGRKRKQDHHGDAPSAKVKAES
ncbi:la protein homolog [Pectinophora gossypiella]|uniref:La protein homolog n=1 Tax=Pectinophora gossypiella TaxID=13191 RepID=A0A1E1WJX8_PECGO|nr:la protein homolog [Pectinophora gossypiella]